MGFRNPITSLVDPVARAAAADAQASANNALAVASSRNHVFVQTSAPTTQTAALALDDLWINPANGYQMRSWDGSAWQPVAFGTAAIAAAAITTDLIAAGAIGAGQIAADAIDGKTITGATVHAGTLDTGASTSAPGVTISQGGTTGPDITTTYGQVAFRDGFSGDTDATITRRVTVNPRSNATSGAGSLTLDGGTYGGAGGPHAPILTLGVEADSGGGYVPRARINFPLGPSSGEGLTELTVASPFINFGGIYAALHVRKDASGVVHCWGLLRNNGTATVSSGNLATGVPARLVPPSGVGQVPGLAYSSSGGVARVDVNSSGALILAVGSIAAGAYLVVNFSWPGPDLTT
jgi:hypothetical protein